MEDNVEIIGEYSNAVEEIGPLVEKLLNKFGRKELLVGDIDFPRFNFVWFSPKTAPNWVAKVIKTPSYYKCLGVKPLTIVCLKEVFNSSTPEVVKAILFHELMHITFDEMGNYKLIDHDIKDFEFLVKKIGLRYENADQMFSDL